jgi:bifunctional non-homologous end joining protein LigD
LAVVPRYTAMQPTQVKQPFHHDGWVYEEKIDGWRMLASKDGRTVRLESRNGVDHTRRSPELAAAVAALASRTLVFDGEVAIFDRQLRSRFDCCAIPTMRRWRRRPC